MFCQSYQERINGQYCLSRPSVVPTSTALRIQVGLESILHQTCHLYCCCGHTYLPGRLVGLAFTLLGRVEMGLVMSRHLPPHPFHHCLTFTVKYSISSLSQHCVLKFVMSLPYIVRVKEKKHEMQVRNHSYILERLKQRQLPCLLLSQQVLMTKSQK